MKIKIKNCNCWWRSCWFNSICILIKKGYSVTIFEKYDYLGGLLVHGIPEFRLPKKIVKDTIQKILNLGLQVEYNKELGKNFTLQELEDKFDAVFLAYGANITTKMGVDGENLQGVFGGNQLLEKSYIQIIKEKSCCNRWRKCSNGLC